jgi:septum formation protein
MTSAIADRRCDLIIAFVRLVLASASPRRAELLRAGGFTFDSIVADVDEQVRPGESPSAYVRRLAAEKSAAVMAGLKARTTPVSRAPVSRATVVVQAFRPADDDVVVLGADTAVVLDGEVLGKPRDDEDAAAMLRRLSGRRHEVLTGISLRQGAYEVGRVETTIVHFTVLSEAGVLWYVASGEGRDKAGAYAIQGLASRFIPRIEGSYSNVVGLPVACVAELLTEIRH